MTLIESPHYRGARTERLWPDPLVDQLHTLFAADKTTMREMAAILGRSRNATIAKCHRLGLHRGNRNAASRRVPEPKRPHEAKRPYRRADWAVPGLYARDRNKERLPPAVVVDLPVERPVNPVTLLELREDHCRWPVSGDGVATLFCGAQADGCPYCERHARMVYRGRS